MNSSDTPSDTDTPHPIRVLILDDDPDRHAAFARNNPDCQIDAAYNCHDAITMLYDNWYDIICFDHDLGETPGGQYETSIPFAKFVRQQIDDQGVLDTTLFVVHTSNPVGAQDILSYFARTQNLSFKIPWAWTMPNLFKLISEKETA